MHQRILSCILLSVLFAGSVYCMDGDIKKKVNLTKLLSLNDINKITIETNGATRPYINKTIVDKKIISKILKELEKVDTMPVVDIWVHYNLIFYSNGSLVCKLGFHDDPEYPFLRYMGGGAVEYIPDKAFCKILQDFIATEQ